ncbi:MAG: hypothetical protein PHF63_05450 [Herbinix sp.]|nr:hypothetical protein [Herbinix sp.]
MDEIETLHINKSRAFIDFMLSQQQWSGLTKIDVEKWLSNFRELQPKEMILVFKLLTNLIYFSEKDVLEALKEGIHNCLFYNVILEKQKAANFNLSQHALSAITKLELRKTCFIPLLDSDSPHESGNYVTRMLVQHGLIQPNQSMFLNKIVTEIRKQNFSRLVIVDDCVGSGDQLKGFWNTAVVNDKGNLILLKDFCTQNDIDANYLTLFGYNKSIDELKQTFIDLKICCVRELSDVQRVFANNSYIWSNENERNEALMLFNDMTGNCGIPLYGYKGLDFAFIMHQTIPDWSLPLLWKENADWKLLMRRKNSNA